MAALKTSFESLGFSDVKTYINSGNVIFRSKEKDARKLEEKLETMLKKEYGLKSRVMIRSLKEMERVVQTIDQACGDDNWKHNVLFLSAEAEKNNLVGELVIKEDIEKIVYTPGVLIWSAKKHKLTRSNMIKLSGKPIYQEMTARNTNTPRKLLELMRKM